MFGVNNYFDKTMFRLFSRFILITLIGTSSIFCNACMGEYAGADEEKIAKNFTIKDKTKSQIYIYRPNHIYGSWVKKRVWIDGKSVGDIVSGSFTLTVVNPGYHVVSTRSEFGNNHILVKTKSGHNYFVKQNIKYGVFNSGSGIRLMKPDYAKKIIKDLDLLIDANDESYDIDRKEIENVKQQMLNNRTAKIEYPAK